MDLRRATAGVRSVLDPRVLLHCLRLLRYLDYAHVQPRRAVQRGRRVALAPNVSIRNGARVVLGDGCHVGEQCFLWAGDTSGRIVLGKDALLGPRVFLTASNYRFDEGCPVMDQAKEEADVVIGAGTWLGAGVIVLPGVTVGDGAIVAAGSVVSRSLPPGAVAAGVPATVRRYREGWEPAPVLVEARR